MGLPETLVFYVCVGATIAAAIFLVEDRRSRSRTRFFDADSSAVLAVVYAAVVIEAAYLAVTGQGAVTPEADEMARTIAQVELELEAALSSLDGWAESALAAEADRLAELCHALRAQAARIREMDKLLGQTELATKPRIQLPIP